MSSAGCLQGTGTVQGAHSAGPCLPGAKQGLSLKLPARAGCVCSCLVLLWWVLCCLGDLTCVCLPNKVILSLVIHQAAGAGLYPACKAGCEGFPFLLQQQIVRVTWERHGGPRAVSEVCSCSSISPQTCWVSSSHSLLLIPRSPLVHRLNNVSVLWLCHILSFERCQVLNFLDFWQQGAPQITSLCGEAIPGQDLHERSSPACSGLSIALYTLPKLQLNWTAMKLN